MSRTNEDTGSSAGQTFRDTASNVSQSLRDAGSHARDAAAQARDAAAEKIGQIRDHANDYYESGKQRAQEWEQGLEDYVREKPIQSLLIAAGVGMLLGVLWKRS
jgi:ElaB/YqjD/DUF883 family membrane-anchored ribosome-binding protein